jgi:hypothetical protein
MPDIEGSVFRNSLSIPNNAFDEWVLVEGGSIGFCSSIYSKFSFGLLLRVVSDAGIITLCLTSNYACEFYLSILTF